MANENNKTDYTKPYTDLSKLLPEPYRSDVNISLFNNIFNRYLTKREIEKISGYIGRGNKNAIVSRQIKEATVHRQAYQLQPILYDKIGSIEHMASWKDIQRELERLGVDIEDFAKWGATESFNWVPPIDINKLINYRDYYWVDLEKSKPQYITIRSSCNVAEANLSFFEGLSNQFGSTFPIEQILRIDDFNTLPNYSIKSITSNTIIIDNDGTLDLLENDFFDIIGTGSNDGTYQISSTPIYNSIENETSFNIIDNLTTPDSGGNVVLRRFDKIAISANSTIDSGDYSLLFAPDFEFIIRNSTNLELNNIPLFVEKSEFDTINNRTIITITTVVTDDTADGEITLEEQITLLQNIKDCECNSGINWDDAQWDDNPSNPLWGDNLGPDGNPPGDGISDHQNLLDRISNTTPPVIASPLPAQNELWFDTTDDKLYSYDIVSGWKLIWNDFSIILDQTNGQVLWDVSNSCAAGLRIKAIDQWSSQNKWKHKNEITNFSNTVHASQPIIEYDWDIELNEWTYTEYKWSYRNELDATFTKTDNNPPLIELEPITWWENQDNNNTNNLTIILDDRYGDLTNYFSPEKKINILSNAGSPPVTEINTLEVNFSEYKSDNNKPYRTYVTFTTKPISDDNLLTFQRPNTSIIYPTITENGDIWQGYGVHWLFVGANDTVPVPHQIDNPYTVIDINSMPVNVPSSGTPLYQYKTSLYAQSNLVLVPSHDEFILSDAIPSTGGNIDTTRSLRRKALYGFDDIRVYLSNIIGQDSTRQLGTYEEIGEAVFNITSIDYANNEFILGHNADFTNYFNSGDKIRIRDNTGIGSYDTIVSTTSPTISSRIKVDNIPSNVTNTGTLSNITTPVPPDDFSNSKNVTLYTIGIKFFTGIPGGLSVVIEVGEATINEIGHYSSKVRFDINNEQFNINGTSNVSRIQYRKVEQVKNKNTQYPLFDLYNIDGTPAYKANPIFGYKTSQDSDIDLDTGLRIVYDSIDDVYEFDQFILEADNKELLAYRDYSNKETDFWYNKETNQVFFWDNIQWNTKTQMSEFYREAVVSPIEPASNELNINGLFWYDTTLDILKKRNTNTLSWELISPIDRGNVDINLQTIWKGGLNNEEYIPDKVDWERRSKEEYDTEKDIFVTTRSNEIVAGDPSITLPEAKIQATVEWFKKQANPLSENGTWVGDWEIPDPLYFNNLHENKKVLSSRELLAHFTTIINKQPNIPGYSGTSSGMFNLIPSDEVNYGYGGTIKEFNNGFDSLLSSTFVNNVTPRSLIDFAHDQYESLLNTIKEIYRKQAVGLLSNIETQNILNLTDYITDEVILSYELNDYASSIYGDSTTFTDVDGVNDLGVKNWIATLPYIKLINKHVPERIIDSELNLNEIVHHDSHRNSYELTNATKDVISQILINLPDERTASDTLGRSSINPPPNDTVEFESNFSTPISNREGVYWYHQTRNILYRYVVVESGLSTPPLTNKDGTLWMDLNNGDGTLRIKTTDNFGNMSWDVVDGLSIGDGFLHNGITSPTDISISTISAWQVINLDVILGDILFELETRLYDNAPTDPILNYNFFETANKNPIKYIKYLEETFLDYVSQNEISTPLENTNFDFTNPFTWNYKTSTTGQSIIIIEADGLTNSFKVSGDKVWFFDPCSAISLCPSEVEFFIKNSIVNDGTWKTLVSVSGTPIATYDISDDTTTVFVQGDVKSSFNGIIYSGILPSIISDLQPNNLNDGSESGGDWRDYYQKLYNTPYPHKEPWNLQGYIDKPDWWDSEYLNDDVNQWGKRTWKYKHGFDIIKANNFGGSPPTYGTFSINGNFNINFISNDTFVVDNSSGIGGHNGTYTVANHDTVISVTTGIAGSASFNISDINDTAKNIYFPGMIFTIINQTGTPPVFSSGNTYTIEGADHNTNDFTIRVKEEIATGDIIPNSSFINGVLYDPIENITNIKTTTLVGNNPAEGRITQTFGMWENIRLGNIPAGRVYPDGIISITGNPKHDNDEHGLAVPILPTFNYFSVNIYNDKVSSDQGTTNFEPDSVFPPYWDYTEEFSTTPNNIDKFIRSVFFDFSTEIKSPNANYIFGDSGPIEWEWRTSSQYLYDQLTVAYRIDPSNYVYQTFGFDFTTIDNLKLDKNTKNTASHTRVNFHGDIIDNVVQNIDGTNQWYVNFNRFSGYDVNFFDFRSLWTQWTAPLTYQFNSFIDTPSLSIAHRFVSMSNFDYTIASKRSPGISDTWLDAFKISILNIPYDIALYDNQIDWRFEIRTNLLNSRTIKYYDVYNYQFNADVTNNKFTLYSWNIIDLDTFNKTFTITGDQTYVFTPDREFIITGSTGNDESYITVSSTFDKIENTTKIKINTLIESTVRDGVIKADYRKLQWVTGDGVYLSTTKALPIPLSSDNINGLVKYFIYIISDTEFQLSETYEDALAGNIIPITTQGKADQFVGEITNTFLADGGSKTDILWKYYKIDKSNILSFSTPHEIQGMQQWVDIVHGYDVYSNDIGWIINADKSEQDPDSNRIISWQIELERFITYSYTQQAARNYVPNTYPVTVGGSPIVWTFVNENRSYITGDSVNVISSNNVYPTPINRNIKYYIIRDSLESFRLAETKTDAENGIAINITITAGIEKLSILTPKEFRSLIPTFEINPFKNASWINTPQGVVSNIITGPSEDIFTNQTIFDQNGNKIQSDQLRIYRQDKETKIVVVDAINPEPKISFISPEYNLLHMGGLHLFTDGYEHVMILNNYNSVDNLLYDPFIGLNVTKYEMLFNRQLDFTQRPNVGGYYLETFFNQGANLKENFEAGVENLRNAYDTYVTLETDLMTQYSRKTLGYDGIKDYLSDLKLSNKSQFIFWRGQIQSKGSLTSVEAFINSRRFIDAKLDEYWAVKVGSFGSVNEKEYPEMFVTTVDARSNEARFEFIDNDADPLSVESRFTPIKMSNQERWYNQPNQVEILRNNGKIMYFDLKPYDKKVFNISGTENDIIVNNGKQYIEHNLNSDTVEITQMNNQLTADVLIENTHYKIINNNVIEFIFGLSQNPISIWGMVFNNDAQNPARIVDRDSETQITTVQYWDPDRGHHYHNAIHNVDLQNKEDPAKYNNTPMITTYLNEWGNDLVGTSWLDESNVDYIPYQSNKVTVDSVERFRNWGVLADWSEIKIYEWVSSNILPSQWDAVALQEKGDRTIPESIRKSGIAKKTLFKNTGTVTSPIWEKYNNEFDKQFTSTKGIDNLDGTYTFKVDVSNFKQAGSPLQYFVNVYINGKLIENDASLIETSSPVTYEYTTETKEADIITFAQLAPTDQTIIDNGIADNTILQEYEYTQVPFYNELGILTNTYYFWVENKTTTPLDKNRTMSLLEAQQQLVNIPSAYIFFQNPVPSIEVNEDAIVNRQEFTTAAGSPAFVTLELSIANGTIPLVEIDGEDIPDNELFYTTEANPQTITFINRTPTSEVKITYMGVYDEKIDIPYRFTQAIIRGLQGVVNADRRYTIRFTRNFTLRDTLDVENENIGPVELKNLHEEWKIFRQEQQFNIDRWQWDKITESIIGYKLSDVNIRVPSFERNLYDEKYGTDTQYGLGNNQTFVNGNLAIATIISYLINPDIDFSPIDINTFFANNSFDTNENIIKAMDEIYNTFTFKDVNRMYFSVMFDAFTTKEKYVEIFKTSMVSLHGIKPFQVNGVFD